MDNTSKIVSKQTLKRLPYYLNYIKSEECAALDAVSAGKIAGALQLTEIQVRKDLASVSDGGRPRRGYDKEKLIGDIESFMGLNKINRAVLVGAGRLGQALLHYDGCRHCGVEIMYAFDTDPYMIGNEICGIKVENYHRIGELCKKENVRIGIVTVPAVYAQKVCDTLIEAGIQAIWNFAPVLPKVPDDIIIHNENMAGSLTLLSHNLTCKLNND